MRGDLVAAVSLGAVRIARRSARPLLILGQNGAAKRAALGQNIPFRPVCYFRGRYPAQAVPAGKTAHLFGPSLLLRRGRLDGLPVEHDVELLPDAVDVRFGQAVGFVSPHLAIQIAVSLKRGFDFLSVVHGRLGAITRAADCCYLLRLSFACSHRPTSSRKVQQTTGVAPPAKARKSAESTRAALAFFSKS